MVKRAGLADKDQMRALLMRGGALVALAVLIVCFLALNTWGRHALNAQDGFVHACAVLADFTIPTFVAALLAYLVVSGWLSRKGLDDATWYERRLLSQIAESLSGVNGVREVTFGLGDPDWAALFSDCQRLDIVGTFFAGILHRMGGREAFALAFRERGLTVRVIVPRPGSLAMEVAHLQRNAHSEVLGVTQDGVEERSIASVELLRNAWQVAGKPVGALSIFHVDDPVHIAAYCFNESLLVYSPVSMRYTSGSRPPRVTLDLMAHPQALEYWKAEWAAITSKLPESQS